LTRAVRESRATATALAGGRGTVQPGDTIWLLGGVYAGRFDGTLSGTSAAPIVVRQYPGERATIDGNLHVHGAYAVYWGFEITQSNPVANADDALETYGPNCKVIKLIVHDAGKQGMSFWEDARPHRAHDRGLQHALLPGNGRSQLEVGDAPG
jgi:hypothetical protein